MAIEESAASSKAQNVTAKTRELVQSFEHARTRVNNMARQLLQAKNDLHEVTQKLGEFLSPEDAKFNEVFNIWYGASLLSVFVASEGATVKRYDITWRTRSPKDFV